MSKLNSEANIQQLAKERLEEGREYGYSELCKILGLKVYNSNSGGQKTQLSEISKARKVEEVPGVWRGRTITRYKIGKIKEYYDEVEASCNIDRSHWRSKGIYSIILDNTVYIGKTEVGFRSRFMQHHTNYNNTHEKTKQLMLEGEGLTPIYFMNDIEDSTLFLMAEDLFVSIYKDMGYYVINERTNFPKPKSKLKKRKIKVFEKDLEKILEFAIKNNISIEIY